MVERNTPDHKALASDRPAEQGTPDVSSIYGLTPKVEAAIQDMFRTNQWHRLRMLIDPLHPADKADLLERISLEECKILINHYGRAFDPEILPYLDEDVREHIVGMLDPDLLAGFLPELDSDDVVTIAEELQPDELNDALSALPTRDRVLVEESLAYPEDSAGRLMQREMVMVPPYWTVGKTIDYLRSSALENDDFYLIMVTDTAGHPIGEVRLNKLLCTIRPRRISEIMDTDMRSIPVTMDQEEVAALFRRYGMVTTGVVDNEGRLVGIITLDDIIDVIDEEAEEDIMKLAGVSDASIRTSVFNALKGRTPWLLVNLMTAVLASIVIGFFDQVIEKIVALAVLMPIVASMGGNAGTQTVTIAVRAIAMREFSQKRAIAFGLRELYVGFINGLIFAGVTATLSYFWFGEVDIALILAIAMLANLVVAALSGTLIPLVLVRIGVDPAIAASVFITTITDVIGFFLFLGLAALYL